MVLMYNIKVNFVRKDIKNKEDGNEFGSGLFIPIWTPETLSFLFYNSKYPSNYSYNLNIFAI